MIYNVNDEKMEIAGLYNNAGCFLVCSGPSLKNYDIEKINRAGIIKAGVNNSARIIRPNIWVSVDDPANFMISIWQDAKIMKFVHRGKKNKKLWDNNRWDWSGLLVRDCPNVLYYKDNEYFNPDTYLTENSANWGNHTDRCECGYYRKERKIEKICSKCNKKQWGSRSVLLAAIKILYVLGFRKIFLLGADFSMTEQLTYAFEQERTRSAVKNNNETYKRLNERFDRLRPIFEKNKLFIWNCYNESGLKSFDYMNYESAINMLLNDFPDVKNERTIGMYNRKADEKEKT